MSCPTGRTAEQFKILELQTELNKYKKAYNILMDLWDYIPEEIRPSVDKELNELDL